MRKKSMLQTKMPEGFNRQINKEHITRSPEKCHRTLNEADGQWPTSYGYNTRHEPTYSFGWTTASHTFCQQQTNDRHARHNHTVDDQIRPLRMRLTSKRAVYGALSVGASGVWARFRYGP